MGASSEEKTDLTTETNHPPVPSSAVALDEGTSGRPTNEYVLNVAFLSFLLFTTLQLFFAVIARSESMMADCAAMYVDVVTYLFNFMAERLKIHHDSTISARDLRLRRLYLELFPPSLSVITLLVVTAMALRLAFATLSLTDKESKRTPPDLKIMLAFSALNLLLDIFNVGCFARVDQATALIGEHRRSLSLSTVVTEMTPLIEEAMGSSVSNKNDEDDSQDSEIPGGINLNMCSAFTHIAADTLRSVAVLIAAGFASLFPSFLSPIDADSYGAILVSGIILVSIVPLIQGLYLTACKVYRMHYPNHGGFIAQSSSSLEINI